MLTSKAPPSFSSLLAEVSRTHNSEIALMHLEITLLRQRCERAERGDPASEAFERPPSLSSPLPSNNSAACSPSTNNSFSANNSFSKVDKLQSSQSSQKTIPRSSVSTIDVDDVDGGFGPAGAGNRGAKAANQGDVTSPTANDSFNKSTTSLSLHSKRRFSNGSVETVEKSTPLLRFVNHQYFDLVFTFAVVGNILLLAVIAQEDGMDTEVEMLGAIMKESTIFSRADYAFWIVSWCFEVVFVVEVALKLLAYHASFFNNPVNVVDLVIVVVCFVAQIVSNAAFDPKLLRIMRMFKLVRLAKLAKAFHSMDGLYVMMTALHGSMIILLWAVIFLVAIQFTFALILNQFLMWVYIKNPAYPLHERQEVFVYFGTFSRAFLTNFEMTLANWPPVARLLVENVSQWFILFCVLHKLTIGFAVVGVINGVFMQESFKVAAQDDLIMVRQKEKTFHMHAAKMRSLFAIADETGDGTVDLEEFRAVARDAEVKTWLASMDLDISDADTIFELIDTGDGSVTQTELLSGVGRLKGAARSIDLHMLKKEVGNLKVVIANLRDVAVIAPSKEVVASV